MKTEFFPKPTDECAKTYSCQKIKFFLENPNNPFLEITFNDDKNRFLLWNTILDKHQFFNEATGEVETQFDISRTRDNNKIILRGNVYNALGVLCKIKLISKEMFDEIYAGPNADKELKEALDANKSFKLLSQSEKVKRGAIERKPTEILAEIPSDKAEAQSSNASMQLEEKEDSSEKRSLKRHVSKISRISSDDSSSPPIAGSKLEKSDDEKDDEAGEEHSTKARRMQGTFNLEKSSLSSSSSPSIMGTTSSSSSSYFFSGNRVQEMDQDPLLTNGDAQTKDARDSATPPLSQH